MFKFLPVVVLLLGAVSADPFDLVDVFAVPDEVELGYRLQNDTEPIRYDITLTTHIHLGPEATDDERFAFTGVVLIHLLATGEATSIVIHQRQLRILNAQLTKDINEDPLQDWDEEQIEYNTQFEQLVFNLENPLVANEVYTLQIEYSGTLRGNQAGFYRSSYVDEAGTRHWLATTQFESTDARHAFPCYDEPGIRAPMGVTIIHGSNYFAVSNSPVKSKVPAAA